MARDLRVARRSVKITHHQGTGARVPPAGSFGRNPIDRECLQQQTPEARLASARRSHGPGRDLENMPVTPCSVRTRQIRVLDFEYVYVPHD